MLYAMLAACATLIFVLALAVPHAAAARRLARLFRAQQVWAELMDRHEEEKLGRFARTELRGVDVVCTCSDSSTPS